MVEACVGMWGGRGGMGVVCWEGSSSLLCIGLYDLYFYNYNYGRTTNEKD